MSTVSELFTSDSLSARVAAEVRGQAAKRGLMQKDIAAALGMSAAQMSERMRGRVPFRIDELEILASIFDVDPADLLPRKWAPRGSNPEPTGLVTTQVDAGVIMLPGAAERLRRSADRRRATRPIQPRPLWRPYVTRDARTVAAELETVSC